MSDFADYVVFADESGDHGLDSIDPEFPIFALAFCLLAKTDYVETVVPAFQRFKFAFWGHDGVVFHERAIRKSEGHFGLLRTDRDLRDRFFAQLNKIMNEAPMWVFASIINKHRLAQQYAEPRNPYEIALNFCMERLLLHLKKEEQDGRLVHVMFESRGRREDRELELEFRRIVANRRQWGHRQPDFSAMRFEPVFVNKSANSTGLQLADLTARPVALSRLRPGQPNRAFDIIQPKLAGLKEFP